MDGMGDRFLRLRSCHVFVAQYSVGGGVVHRKRRSNERANRKLGKGAGNEWVRWALWTLDYCLSRWFSWSLAILLCGLMEPFSLGDIDRLTALGWMEGSPAFMPAPGPAGQAAYPVMQRSNLSTEGRTAGRDC